MSSLAVDVLGLAVLAGSACSPPYAIAPPQPDAGGGDAAAASDAPTPPPVDASYSNNGMLELEGDISPVHDPVIIASATRFYVYSTGEGLPVRESEDLVHWRITSSVFSSKPSWITTTPQNNPNALWAPDVSYFGGQYHLYYAASSFGSQASCIGHATTANLDDAVWEDHGPVICSAPGDGWNAIDPAAFVDQAGDIWLSLGSFWSGLKLLRLDTTGARMGDEFYSLATRSNTAVEAPYIVRQGNYYYLFESVDRCCQGVDSTYKIMAGRSTDIAGPYLDRDNRELADGGGTLILASGSRWKGPGHNAILHTANGDYNVYHSYDAQSGGTPTLRIAELKWTGDGWPISAGP